jgi:hypothetical protein
MKGIKDITLEPSENSNDSRFNNLAQGYLSRLETKLKAYFPEIETAFAGEGRQVDDNTAHLTLGIEPGDSFKVKIYFPANSPVSQRFSSFIKEELRKWIVLYGYSIEIVINEPNGEGDEDTLLSSIKVFGEESLIESRLSDDSFVKAFCDAVSSGIREYIHSN